MNELIHFIVEHYQSALAVGGGGLAFLLLTGGIFGSGDTSSNATETDQAVTDEGTLKVSSGKAQLVETGAVGVSGSARLQTGGIAGNVGANTKVGTTEYQNSPVTITTSDPELLKETFNTFSSSLADVYSRAGEDASEQSNILTGILGKQVEEVAKTDEDKKRTFTLWLVGLGIAAAVVIIALWTWRK